MRGMGLVGFGGWVEGFDICERDGFGGMVGMHVLDGIIWVDYLMGGFFCGAL